MPKVSSPQTISRFTATPVTWSIAGLFALVTLGCNLEKPQELNPPPAESVSAPAKIEAKPAAVPTQPVAVTPADTQPISGAPSTTQPASPAARAESEIPIDGPARGPKPGVTPLPTTVPTSEPAVAAPATDRADAGPPQSQPSVRSFTGTLHGGILAAGSETTGWALQVDGATGALDIDVTAISGQVKALDGRHVTITGQLKEKDWVERGKTQLLIAETIAVAPLPEMNK